MLAQPSSSAILLPELPSGLLRDKGEARELFLQHGLPQRGSPAAERWKYTPLGKVAQTRLYLAHKEKGWSERVAERIAKARVAKARVAKPSVAKPSVAKSVADRPVADRPVADRLSEIDLFPDASLLLFVDGRLQERCHARTPEVTPYAGLPRVASDQPLAALNVGSHCEAWRVVLDETTPFVHALFLTTEPNKSISSQSSSQPSSLPLLQTRLRIEAVSGSTTFVQTFDEVNPCWSNDLIELEVAEGAHLEHVVLQRRSKDSCGFSRTTARVGEKSSYAHISALRGEGLTRQEVSVALEGVDASCKLHGAYRTEGKGHIDNDTEIFHNRAHGTSDALYKGVLEDKGRGVFHGKIFVAPEAQETQGYQMSRALLLSERAQAYHKPELEIYADNVKCSHGATIGALDEEQLLYLRSRGIVRARAEEILLQAFVAEALHCQRKDCAEALQSHMQSEQPRRA